MKLFRRILPVLTVILVLFVIVSCKTETIVYGNPSSSDATLIFYPGGRVDPNAYSDLCNALNENGIAVIVAEMPLDLAVLGRNRASGIIADYPSVSRWFIGGHSLGGVMAATWCSKNADKVGGLVLLAAYSTKELSLPVLSIYGSNDGVLKMKNYTEALGRLSDVEEHVIPGGNHCQFGSYGFQKGDNEAAITYEEQLRQTADFIVSFISSH